MDGTLNFLSDPLWFFSSLDAWCSDPSCLVWAVVYCLDWIVFWINIAGATSCGVRPRPPRGHLRSLLVALREFMLSVDRLDAQDS